MVLLYGIPGDGPFELVADALEEIKTPFIIVNPRQFQRIDVSMHFHNGQTEGEITIDAQSYALSSFTGIYNRVVDFSTVPEAKKLLPHSQQFQQYSLMFQLLNNWIETTACRVLNKASAMSSNSSKPYQLTLIKPFFDVPDTMITNRLSTATGFQKEGGGLIYKSASSVRSIVKVFNEGQASNIKSIQYCPILFQEKLVGTNHRVHIVGEEVFAIKASSDSIDYRYSSQEGNETNLEPVILPESILERCILLSKALQLPLAGIDLFECEDGRWFCFEVNPSPGFSYFETKTGQPIAHEIARYLSAGTAAG